MAAARSTERRSWVTWRDILDSAVKANFRGLRMADWNGLTDVLELYSAASKFVVVKVEDRRFMKRERCVENSLDVRATET